MLINVKVKCVFIESKLQTNYTIYRFHHPLKVPMIQPIA